VGSDGSTSIKTSQFANSADDIRNLIDQFKGLSVETYAESWTKHARSLHIAIENWGHDFSIGSIIRIANAFNVASVSIIGSRRWNKRGAMMTDVYLNLNVNHFEDIVAFEQFVRQKGLQVLAIDCLPGVSTPLEVAKLQEECVMLFGSESSGVSSEAQNLAHASAGLILHITQHGSTRSINAEAAAAVTMYQWSREHQIWQIRR
jgi:tRNA G18 (ribose-2'-O)-methylase SpoU